MLALLLVVCVYGCVCVGGGVFSASQRPVLCISFSLYRMFRPPLAIHSLLLGFRTSLSVSVLKVCSLLWISEWGPVRSTSLDMHIHTSLEIPLSFMPNLQNCSVTMMTTHFSLLFVLLLLTVCGPWKILHACWMNEWMNEQDKIDTIGNNFIAVSWLIRSTHRSKGLMKALGYTNVSPFPPVCPWPN